MSSLPPMSKKPLSSCCERPAKVNMVARAIEGATRFYFCTHCGEPCDISHRRTPFKGSTLSATRKPSGEMDVFKARYVACGGVSMISGQPLYPPGHKMFHWQMAHVLCKNNYPEERLNPDNIWPMTVEEHQYQTNDPGKCRRDPQWSGFWAHYDRSKLRAETKSRA